MSNYTFAPTPKYAGGYQIGGPMGLRINFTKKPRWLHRMMMRWAFGWKWEDA